MFLTVATIVGAEEVGLAAGRRRPLSCRFFRNSVEKVRPLHCRIAEDVLVQGLRPVPHREFTALPCCGHYNCCRQKRNRLWIFLVHFLRALSLAQPHGVLCGSPGVPSRFGCIARNAYCLTNNYTAYLIFLACRIRIVGNFSWLQCCVC